MEYLAGKQLLLVLHNCTASEASVVCRLAGLFGSGRDREGNPGKNLDAHGWTRAVIEARMAYRLAIDRITTWLADVHVEGDLPKVVTILWLNDQGLLAGTPFREPDLWRLMARCPS